MGYKLWDSDSRKIVCSHSVFFDKIKMHTKPIKTMEIKRVIFQEDGQTHRDLQACGQAPPPQGHEEEVREDE